MFTELSLQDFKAFHAESVELRPITVLLGPNNAGKSSIVAALRLLAQTLRAPGREVPLLLDGPLGDFGTYRDIVHGNYRGRPFRLRLQGSADARPFDLSLEFKYRTAYRELILREAVLRDDGGHLLTIRYSDDLRRHVVARLGGLTIATRTRAATANALGVINFLPWLNVYPQRGTPRDVFGRRFSDESLVELSRRIDQAHFGSQQLLYGVDYISAMRAPPERTYHQTGETRAHIGARGENWAGILVQDQAPGQPGGPRITPRVADWLLEAGLAEEVRLQWLSDRHYEVQIRHPVSGEYQNLADVGQGNSQVIPVLVGGYRLAEGATYLVEEPEIHLHPRAQAELGAFFRDLYASGVASLIETHSEYLILRLQQYVAAGEVKPEDVVFYYVYADQGTGHKQVRELGLDELGRFTSELPGGFFPERLAEARRLARLRGEKVAGRSV